MCGRYLLILAFSAVLSLAVIGILPATGIARPTAEVSWVESLYSSKEAVARAIRGPRILAVGGSGTLFSFDSKLASKLLHRPVVNFGTHAGLGLPYILNRATQVIRPGDLVLLAPEYDLLQLDDNPNELQIQFVKFYDPGFIERSPPREWLAYNFGYGVLQSLYEGIKQAFRGRVAGRPDITLDDFGNVRGNTVEKSVGLQLANASPTFPVAGISDGEENALRKFATDAAARHVTVVVIPVSLIHTTGFCAPTYRLFLASLTRMYSQLGLQVLGDPAMTYLLPSEMYDSIYHANDEGRARYTEIIVGLLRDFLSGDHSPGKGGLPTGIACHT
jgi:hypothetical protein